jgi:hypothetical protein
MQYTEVLMTNGMADQVHNNTVAFSNCLIRIPNSHNSKYIPKDVNGRIILTSPFPPQSKVRIEQSWNGYKPNIRYLLEGLWEQLIQLRNNEISERMRFEIKHPYDVSPCFPEFQVIDWVDRLLQNPLGEWRKYCITFILVPYFLNIKRMSDLDAEDKTMTWLEKCRAVCRLNFNAKSRVK